MCNRNIISLSHFFVFILNTIVHIFTLLLLKRYPNIKRTYQYFHLPVMFTFAAKKDEKLLTMLQRLIFLRDIYNECFQ